MRERNNGGLSSKYTVHRRYNGDCSSQKSLTGCLRVGGIEVYHSHKLCKYSLYMSLDFRRCHDHLFTLVYLPWVRSQARLLYTYYLTLLYQPHLTVTDIINNLLELFFKTYFIEDFPKKD